MPITIGPVHIADADGTHEPGEVIETPCEALVALADNKTIHPETGLPYASHTVVTAPVSVVAAPVKPAPEVPEAR